MTDAQPPIAPELKNPESEAWQGLPPIRRTRGFKMVIWCWAFPLITGLLGFLLWVIFRWEIAEGIWFYAYLSGVFLTIVAFTEVDLLKRTRLKTSGYPWREAKFPALVLRLLLFSNIAIGYAVLQLGLWIDPNLLPG